MTKTAHARLIGVAAYSSSRNHETPALNREGKDDYEQRTWREKLHYLPDTGECYIPAMAFKMALDSAAKFFGRQIPGKGKSTYTKHFLSGCLVLENAMLGVQKDDVEFERIYVNADGVRGSGKRVWRYFPVIPEGWSAEVEFHVLDDIITKEVFAQHLADAGAFTGIGRFRPQVGGFKGRFKVDEIVWLE